MNFDDKFLDVEEALYRLALGGLVDEEQAIKVKKRNVFDDGSSSGNVEDVVVVSVKKYYPPNLSAIKFLLTNRKADCWKDNPHKVLIDNENLKLKKQRLDKESF